MLQKLLSGKPVGNFRGPPTTASSKFNDARKQHLTGGPPAVSMQPSNSLSLTSDGHSKKNNTHQSPKTPLRHQQNQKPNKIGVQVETAKPGALAAPSKIFGKLVGPSPMPAICGRHLQKGSSEYRSTGDLVIPGLLQQQLKYLPPRCLIP